MTKRNAEVYEELERTTLRYQDVITQHDSAKVLADALAKERETVRRRLVELDEQTHQEPLLSLLQQIAPFVERAALDNPGGCFFSCLVCRERFPYAILPDHTQNDETVADLARWLGSWQMRFPCGHSLCRLCYERSLKSVYTPELMSTSTGLSACCPLCKKPRYVFLVEDEDSWGADDELLDIENPLHITTAPTPDTFSDDGGDFVPSSSSSSSIISTSTGDNLSDTF